MVARRPLRYGLTVLELLIVLVVIGLIATLAHLKFAEAKERAYVVAMMNDLHNYALAQHEYLADHGRWGALELIEGDGFGYSPDVSPDSSNVTGQSFYLRVRHAKTTKRCELEVVTVGRSVTHDRIVCDGIHHNPDVGKPEPTEPPLPPAVVPPPDTVVQHDVDVDAYFVITNNSSITRTYSFAASASNSFLTILDVIPPSVTLGPGQAANVVVRTYTPSGTPGGSITVVSLKVTDVDDSTFETTAFHERIAANRPPAVTLSCPDQVTVNHSYQCTATYFDSDDNLSYSSWGGLATTKSFVARSTPGTETREVTVYDSEGLSATASVVVQVVAELPENAAPDVSINCPAVVNVGESFTCTASATDPDGDHPLYPSWGAWSQNYSFGAPGTYAIAIEVYDGRGGVGFASTSVRVVAEPPQSPPSNLAPTASVVCTPSTGHIGFEATCILDGEDPDGDYPLIPSWGAWSSTVPVSGLGSFLVSGYVTDSRGLRSPEAFAEIEATNTAPTASVTCNVPPEQSVFVGEWIICELDGSDPDPHPNDDGISPSWGTWSKAFQATQVGANQFCGYVTDQHGASSPEACEIVFAQEQQTVVGTDIRQAQWEYEIGWKTVNNPPYGPGPALVLEIGWQVLRATYSILSDGTRIRTSDPEMVASGSYYIQPSGGDEIPIFPTWEQWYVANFPDSY